MFEQDPSLQTIQNGMPESPVDQSARQKLMHVILTIIFIMVLGLAVVNFLNTPVGEQILGTGAIKGIILSPEGGPFQGELLILGTDQTIQTNTDGSFIIDRAPAGEQSLIVLAEDGGNEIRVNITSGQVLDIGVVQFIETATP